MNKMSETCWKTTEANNELAEFKSIDLHSVACELISHMTDYYTLLKR